MAIDIMQELQRLAHRVNTSTSKQIVDQNVLEAERALRNLTMQLEILREMKRMTETSSDVIRYLNLRDQLNSLASTSDHDLSADCSDADCPVHGAQNQLRS